MVVYPAYCLECNDYSTCPHKQQRAVDRCAQGAIAGPEMRANWEKMTPEERDTNLKENLDALYGTGTYAAHKAMQIKKEEK